MTENKIKYRSLGMQILLSIVTLGCYPFYWFYVTLKELELCTGTDENAFLLTLLLGVPPFCFYSMYKQGEIFERICPDVDRWVTFLLWIFFPPGVWLLVQMKLNRLALEGAPLPLLAAN